MSTRRPCSPSLGTWPTFDIRRQSVHRMINADVWNNGMNSLGFVQYSIPLHTTQSTRNISDSSQCMSPLTPHGHVQFVSFYAFFAYNQWPHILILVAGAWLRMLLNIICERRGPTVQHNATECREMQPDALCGIREHRFQKYRKGTKTNLNMNQIIPNYALNHFNDFPKATRGDDESNGSTQGRSRSTC